MSKLSKAVKKVTKSPLSVIAPGLELNKIGINKILGGPKASGPEPDYSQLGKEEQFAKTIKDIKDAAPADQAKIMAEVDKQKELGTGYANDYASKRSSMLNDLSNLLVNQQNRQLQLAVPDLAEQANLSGIFRSTGLGNSIADRAKTLAEETSNQLALQGLNDRSANISDIQGVNNDYLTGRYSGLSRSFSLEDMARQGEIAKTTGQLVQPAPVQTPSAKGGGALTGALGGAATGGSVGGPLGAGVGAVLGGIGGGKLASK